jgi:uncharacterized protein YgiM (DUF1202 family)
MRRSAIISLVLGLLCLGAAPTFGAENAAVTGDGVRIREVPGTSGKIIMSVNKGARIEVTAKSPVTETIDGYPDSWYAVTYQGKKGYIFGRFVALDPGVAVPAEGTAPLQVPTLGKTTVRPEDILGDWALYGASPAVLYTFEPEGFAQYLALRWDVELSGDKVGRKYLTADLVRGSYTIEETAVRVRWYWGDTAESLFTVQKGKDGVTLTIDGQDIPPRFHTTGPGATTIGDIVINTEPDL